MHLNAEINVVSLIDVMLVLLVIFMLTAPMMQTGMDVNLPELNATPVQTKSGITVTVDAQRTIFINETRMRSLEQFTAAFPTFIAGKQKLGVNFTADKSVDWEFALKVMGVIQASGVTSIGAIGLPVGTPR